VYQYKHLVLIISFETGCIFTTIVIVVSAELVAITCTITATSSVVAMIKNTVIAKIAQMAEIA